MLVRLDLDEHSHVQTKALCVEQCHTTANVAILLQAFDASPTGVGGQADIGGEIGYGNVAILLQLRQELITFSPESLGKNSRVNSFLEQGLIPF